MNGQIVSLNPQALSAYEPLLAGASPAVGGTPLLLGYDLSDVICGVLAADCFDDFLILRWICVDDTYRRRGFGGQLLDTLCTLAADAGIKQIDAVVCLTEDQKAAEILLTHRGFSQRDASPVFSFPLSAVLDGPLAPLIAKKDARAVPLHSVPKYLLRDLARQIAGPGGSQGHVFDGTLPESLVWMEHGVAVGCILLAPCGDGVELHWLQASGAAAVQGLVAGAAGALAASHSPQTVIHATATTSSTEALLRKLAGSQLTVHPPVARFTREL
jgi:GNAT superfamily N-acetyltransferase